ncbi:MAG: ABC transporter permease [Hyphomicrobiaceae bacterium]
MTALDTDQAAVATPRAARRPAGSGRQLLKTEASKGWALMSPALLTIVVGLGGPIVMLLLYSFWTQHYIEIDHTPTFANYQQVLTQPIYLNVFLRSILIAAGATLTTVLICYPVAYFLAFDVKKHRLVWMVLITLPFWTSYLLRVFTWKIILGYNGIINSGLKGVGLIDKPLEFLLYNPFAVYLTLVYGWATFAILPIFVSLDKIDRSYLEAATDLGDTAVERFWRITFPLSLPGVIAAFLVIFIPTVGDYVTPQLVGGPDGLMIANIIQSQFGKANNFPLGAALSITSMVVVTLIAVGFVWMSRRVTERIG